MSRPGHGRRPSRCSFQRFTMLIRADEGWNGGCATPFGSMRHSSPSARMASAPWAGPLTPKLMASSSSTHTAALLFRRHRSSSFLMAGSSGPVRALGGKSSMRRARTKPVPLSSAIEQFVCEAIREFERRWPYRWRPDGCKVLYHFPCSSSSELLVDTRAAASAAREHRHEQAAASACERNRLSWCA